MVLPEETRKKTCAESREGKKLMIFVIIGPAAITVVGPEKKKKQNRRERVSQFEATT